MYLLCRHTMNDLVDEIEGKNERGRSRDISIHLICVWLIPSLPGGRQTKPRRTIIKVVKMKKVALPSPDHHDRAALEWARGNEAVMNFLHKYFIHDAASGKKFD